MSDHFELAKLKKILNVYLIPGMKSVRSECCSFLSHSLYFHEFSSIPSGPRRENVSVNAECSPPPPKEKGTFNWWKWEIMTEKLPLLIYQS